MASKETRAQLITELNSFDFRGEIPENVSRVKTQLQVVAESEEFIRQRAAGKFNYMQTGFKKLNMALGGGIEPNTIFTIGAMSSGGKTTLGTRICNSICNIETNKKAIVLNFNFEMIAHKLVGREICHLGGFDLKHLYNNSGQMTDPELKRILDIYYEDVKSFPIVYVEEPASSKNIENTIVYYWTKLCKGRGITLVVQVDHAAIVTGNQANDKEKDKIDALMQALNRVKKKIATLGGEVIYIVLSQLNRDIQSTERKVNASLHYPQTSDLFAASSIEQYSDYIIFTHNPSKINLNSYTEFNYPVWMGSIDKENSRERPFIYWSVAKNRDGELWDCIPMVSQFQNFTFEELSAQEFAVYHREFKESGQCYRKSKEDMELAISDLKGPAV
jgi:replicative DNA helicase